jgi:hypothetical protein
MSVAATVLALCAAGVVAPPAAAVVGGTLEDPADFPYFVSFPQPYGHSPSCGGSVIADSWILTAAHCVDGVSSVSVFVPAAKLAGTGMVVLHPLWTPGDEGTDGHDVALVHLPAGTLASAVAIQVGAPWDPGAYAAGTEATVMGTGNTSASDAGHGAFLAADTPLRSDDYMDDIFNPLFGYDRWHEDLMIGAGATNQTVCHGDSGSPLIVHRNGTVVQVGVASFVLTDDPCHGAAGFAELSGPQLAWIATRVPSVMDRWGPCVSASGAAGHPAAAYGTYPPGYRWDGPMPWNIWCEAPPAVVPVPDVRGVTLASAVATLQSQGLTRGTVSNRPDPTCNNIGVVMSQSPGPGVCVPPGSPVSMTLGTRPRTVCP